MWNRESGDLMSEEEDWKKDWKQYELHVDTM